MEVLTIDEIITAILEETEGLGAERTEGIILKKQTLSPLILETLQSSLGIEDLEETFVDLILSYNWGDFGFLSYQFGYGDRKSVV